ERPAYPYRVQPLICHHFHQRFPPLCAYGATRKDGAPALRPHRLLTNSERPAQVPGWTRAAEHSPSAWRLIRTSDLSKECQMTSRDRRDPEVPEKGAGKGEAHPPAGKGRVPARR